MRGSKANNILLYAFILILAIGCILRLLYLGDIPAGLHQDEASVGYEAYAISQYGVDRDGNPYPVYPITWGSGGGSPLMIYLNVITTGIFGKSVLVLRMLPAILGIMTLPLFFLILLQASGTEITALCKKDTTLREIFPAFAGLILLALCPWHVMLCRWSLDCNITPFFLTLSMLLFLRGIDKASMPLLGASAASYALVLYSYGSATVVIPLHLAAAAVYFMLKKKLSPRLLIISVLVFFMVFLPLGLFYAVNFLGMPAVSTQFFSIGRFTAHRGIFLSADNPILPQILSSLKIMLLNLSVGYDKELIVNVLPGHAPLFAWTWPIAAAGLFYCLKRRNDTDVLFLSLFIPAFIFGLFVEEDLNRMILLFMPAIYFFSSGTAAFISFADRKEEKDGGHKTHLCLAAVLSAALLISGLSFSVSYFKNYNRLSSTAFMTGYGEAVTFASSLAESGHRKVISTYDGLSAPFMLALYYTGTDPRVFSETVCYRDPDAEFRIADSFEGFVFGLPDKPRKLIKKIKETGDILILSSSELEGLDISGCDLYETGYYCVLSAIPR